MNPDNPLPIATNDHDLLIRVSTQVESLTHEIRAYNTNFAAQVADHETRLRVQEQETQKTQGAQRSQRNYLNFVVAIGGLIVAVATLISIWPHK